MQPMIDLFYNGMVIRGGIPGNPTLKGWLSVYMDYLVEQGIDITDIQFGVYVPADGEWGHFKAAKVNGEWEYTNTVPKDQQNTHNDQ